MKLRQHHKLSTGPLKKLFHYAIFHKFFHIFITHKWSMFTIHVV